MMPGLVDFQNFAKSFDFASKEAISEAREFSKTPRRDFARAVTQGWF